MPSLIMFWNDAKARRCMPSSASAAVVEIAQCWRNCWMRHSMSHPILVGRARSLSTSLRSLGWRPSVARYADHCLMVVTMEEVAPKTMVQMPEKLARYERRSTKVAGATWNTFVRPRISLSGQAFRRIL